jgi:hypothetical protein
MRTTTHRARITSPITHLCGSGRRQDIIPVGPCLVESIGERCVDVAWGAHGQRCATLPVEELVAAWNQGQLMLLD